MLIPATAHAATTHPARSTAGLAGAALNWAEGHALGHPYVFGGSGPGGYDCSGLVMEAYGHADGIWLPHNTGAMLASGRLRQVPISSAPRGALLFFGTGHVELNTRWHDVSFGAQQTGTVVWWHRWFPGSWEPTAAYIVVG